MGLKTKSSIADIGEILSKKGSEFTFQDPPKIAAPFTEIKKLDGSDRTLPDPAQTLKPALGIERVMVKSLFEIKDETDSAGQRIYEAQNKDARFRAVGDWQLD
jgi:hypothetical protein